MGIPKFVTNDRFTVTQVFETSEYETIEVESVEISIDEKNCEKVIKIKILETYFTTFQFDDIRHLIVDIISFTGEIKVRKIFDVKFVSYKQIYDKNKTYAMIGAFSMIEVDFDISNFEVYQDDDLQTIESLIRHFKIRKITDIN